MANLSDEQTQIQFLKTELKKMQSMAALGELTGTATHEFNNVLMTIMNYAKLGIRNRDDASRDKALQKILDASERAAKITSTILAQARNRSESLTPTDLGSIIRDSLVLLEREMRKYRIAVEIEIDPATPAAMASGNQIQRVLLNRSSSDARGWHGFGSARSRWRSRLGRVDRSRLGKRHPERNVAPYI